MSYRLQANANINKNSLSFQRSVKTCNNILFNRKAHVNFSRKYINCRCNRDPFFTCVPIFLEFRSAKKGKLTYALIMPTVRHLSKPLIVPSFSDLFLFVYWFHKLEWHFFYKQFLFQVATLMNSLSESLTLSWWRLLSYRNHNGFRHERVKVEFVGNFSRLLPNFAANLNKF